MHINTEIEVSYVKHNNNSNTQNWRQVRVKEKIDFLIMSFEQSFERLSASDQFRQGIPQLGALHPEGVGIKVRKVDRTV